VPTTLPNYFIIGAAKSGTTSLHHYLAQHPDVFACPIKEPRFFAFHPEPAWRMAGPGDAKWVDTFVTEPAGYQALFAGAGDARARGESSVVYLDTPVAAERICEREPAARIIAILRDPCERAWSQWLMHRRYRGEPYTFRAALAAEDERIAAGWSWRYRYRSRGMYHALLQPWLDRFPRERVLLLLSDDLDQDPRATLRRVFAFLGVDPAFRPNARRRHNASLGRRRRFRRPLRPPLDPQIRRELVEVFRADVMALQALLGRDLDAWLDA
jgi:hypothetical protein